MDYLKSLTAKQWLVIFIVVALLALGYLFFVRSKTQTPTGPTLDTLLRQGRAPQSVNDTLNKSEINKLNSLGRVAPAAQQPKNTMTDAQKNALLKLMSATKK